MTTAALVQTLVLEMLRLSCPITVHALPGGLSGAQLFTAQTDQNTYVVRLFEHKPLAKREAEIEAASIASESGYGPHVYVADTKQAIVIMDYLAPQRLSDGQWASRPLYTGLGNLVRQMHTGPQLRKKIDVFARLHKMIDSILATDEGDHILAIIEGILRRIERAVVPHIVEAPCHNDLTPNNLLFVNGQFKIIDYETAAQADPYFDLATIATFCCFAPEHEEAFFSAYLGRQALTKEKTRLYLMKQVVLINYALIALRKLPGSIAVPESPNTPTCMELLRAFRDGALSPAQRRIFAASLLKQVLTDAASQKFNDAIGVLGDGR